MAPPSKTACCSAAPLRTLAPEAAMTTPPAATAASQPPPPVISDGLILPGTTIGGDVGTLPKNKSSAMRRIYPWGNHSPSCLAWLDGAGSVVQRSRAALLTCPVAYQKIAGISMPAGLSARCYRPLSALQKTTAPFTFPLSGKVYSYARQLYIYRQGLGHFQRSSSGSRSRRNPPTCQPLGN